MKSIQSEEDTDFILSPIRGLCGQFKSMGTKSLFSSWSPPPPKPMPKSIELDKALVAASSGNANLAITKDTKTFWRSGRVSPEGTATWAVNLTSSEEVRAVRIKWRQSKFSDSFAPRTLSISCKGGDSTAINDVFNCVGVFDVDEIGVHTGDWDQTYDIVAHAVTEVKLSMIGISSFNFLNEVRIYSIDILSENNADVVHVNTIDLLYEAQKSLLPLHTYPVIKRDILEAAFSIARISGSLDIIIWLVTYILDQNLDQSCMELVPNAVRELVMAVNAEHLSICSEVHNLYWDPVALSISLSKKYDDKEWEIMLNSGAGAIHIGIYYQR
jgi:hypothetical protein